MKNGQCIDDLRLILKKNNKNEKNLLLGLLLVSASCGDEDKTTLPDNFQEEKEIFITSMQTFLESNRISSELPDLSTSEQEEQGKKR
jgi:hypothetical protein